MPALPVVAQRGRGRSSVPGSRLISTRTRGLRIAEGLRAQAAVSEAHERDHVLHVRAVVAEQQVARAGVPMPVLPPEADRVPAAQSVEVRLPSEAEAGLDRLEA